MDYRGGSNFNILAEMCR